MRGTSKNPLNRTAGNPPLHLAGSAIRFIAFFHAHPTLKPTQKCRANTLEVSPSHIRKYRHQTLSIQSQGENKIQKEFIPVVE
jgi:hypothetical protein